MVWWDGSRGLGWTAEPMSLGTPETLRFKMFFFFGFWFFH